MDHKTVKKIGIFKVLFLSSVITELQNISWIMTCTLYKCSVEAKHELARYIVD